MLTQEQIKSNKDRFITLILSITRSQSRLTEFVAKLLQSDFFIAPASTVYHLAYPGGLCEHCLNVYDNLVSLCESKNLSYNPDSLKITALCHDLSKMNYYTETVKNEKVYSENGTKHDELGNFEWVSKKGYKKRDDVFIYGNHEQNAEYIARWYFPLTLEESTAILHHMGGMSWDSTKENITEVYSKYPLSTLLHLADMISTYIDERP